MNKKGWPIYLTIYLVFLLIIISFTACKDEILEIEESNSYSWQKYMTVQEYEKIEEGMSYLDVVRIAGGAGKEIEAEVETETIIYEWNDELLLTKGYRITFKEGALAKKEIIERRGISAR